MAAGIADAGNERWKAIAGKTGEERILYDPDSVIPSGPRMFRVWIMGFDKDHFPRKSLEEFDCTNRIVRDVEVIVGTTEQAGDPHLHPFGLDAASCANLPGGALQDPLPINDHPLNRTSGFSCHRRNDFT